MKLIVGLGNPGAEYRGNRHNVGFMVVDKLEEIRQKETQIVLLKPQTFMNDSGKAVVKMFNFYKVKLDDLWVIHDDLDIRLGEYKIQKGVGPKVHNGLISIEEQLGGKNFWRVRVGVDNRNKEFRIPGDSYVLDDFDKDEKLVLENVIDKVVNELRLLL